VIIEGNVAIVTGGAGGLGAATVRHLAGIGMKVVVFDMFADGAKAVAEEIGADAAWAAGDLNDDAAVDAAIAAARELGTVVAVVNVAGGATGGGRIVGKGGKLLDKAIFASTMEINAHGTFNVSARVAASMLDNEPDEDGQRGVIVNTASIAGLEGLSGQVAYAAAKGAILGMTLPMARDLAPAGIRVCAIAPGTMGTPKMVDALPIMKEDPSAGVAFPKRMGKPSEFAQLVESIIRNSYLNGENIRLDGGLRFVQK
jgi:NAD(P)-dependent dehydrogenase (short-subunit alcohol dehydrogenase family)